MGEEHRSSSGISLLPENFVFEGIQWRGMRLRTHGTDPINDTVRSIHDGIPFPTNIWMKKIFISKVANRRELTLRKLHLGERVREPVAVVREGVVVPSSKCGTQRPYSFTHFGRSQVHVAEENRLAVITITPINFWILKWSYISRIIQISLA